MGKKEFDSLSIPGSIGPGIEIPFFEYVGNPSGPHLTVLAGIHGAEYCSIAAARKFIFDLDLKDVLGKLTVVPVVNILAFWQRSAFVIPIDNQNLNRAFPGKENGSYTEQYAFYVFERFIKNTDYLLDMHAGDIPESLEPFTLFEESSVEDKSLEMAKSYGIKHIVRQPKSALVVSGSTSSAAASIGVPAITAESGQNGILDQVAVNRHLEGLRNLAISLGVISGQKSEQSEYSLYDGWNWLRAQSEGWWEPTVPTGKSVRKGDLLGTLSQVWGEESQEIRAPEDGRVLFQTSSPAVSRDGILIGLALL